MRSVGVAGLQTGVAYPEMVQAVQLLNISMRQLHVRNQSPFMRPFIKAFQVGLLHRTEIADWRWMVSVDTA